MKSSRSIIIALAITGLSGAQAQHDGPPRRGDDRQPPNKLLQALDTDQDGIISAAELKDASAALTTLDVNSDGQLDAGEWRSKRERGGPRPEGGPPPREQGPIDPPRRSEQRSNHGNTGGFDAEAFMKRVFSHDKNGDGVLSKEELPEALARLLDENDTNQDHSLSKSELEASLARMKERFGRFPKRGRDGRPRRPKPPSD